MSLGVVCRALGGPDLLRLERVSSQPVGDGEVRVAVHAAGINFPDLLTAAGKYQIKPRLPFVLGMEGAGVITEVGKGVDSKRLGERVMGWAWNGFYAEEIVVPESNILVIPDRFGFVEAASFVVATSTAVNALLQRAGTRQGETLLVHGGAGGVGLAAVEVGKLLGAKVIATASSPEKLSLAASRGADYLIDYSQEDFPSRVMELTSDRGADVILDTVGGDVFDQSVDCIAWGGRLLVVGFASGRIPQIKTNKALLKCFSLVGVRALEHVKQKPEEGLAYREWMLSFAEKGLLRPYVSKVYPLRDFRDALFELESRQAQGRIVLQVRSD
ncbi:NADPH:quinone oxidoreductase family protein [Alcaligenaceae bacterium]|nr:NADPH:quinone oxidoreductase family protein [Alcaligenaceae bacterium]